MATQKIERTTELVSTESLAFIRPIVLSAVCNDLRPNTRQHVFFNSVNIDHILQQDGKSIGDAVITDGNGYASFTINVPSRTFNTGNADIVIKESPVFTDVIGTTDVYAKAKFTAAGTLSKFLATETTVNTSIKEVVIQRADPLAQSFFTHGVTGGCYVTSIDLYFNSVDSEMPVWVELRNMSSGAPSNELVAPWARKTLPAVNVNDNSQGSSSIATNFKFDRPVYLKEDGDYCFVVQSRSNKYTLWTSKLGERSIETGKIVFDQPYNGSLFKSENNFTWSAEQNEDIKFKLNVAKFIQPSGQLNFGLTSNTISIPCTSFYTTAGINRVTVKLPFKHAMSVNNKIGILTSTVGTYNGITAADLSSAPVTVKTIVDDFSFSFDTNGSNLATSTGKIKTGGKITALSVYGSPTNIVFSNPPVVKYNGTIIGECILGYDGRIVSTKLVATSLSFTDEPVAVLFDGAVQYNDCVLVTIEEKFYVNLNREFHSINAMFPNITPPGTRIEATLYSTDAANTPGSIVTPIAINKKSKTLTNNIIYSSADNPTITSTRIGISFAQSGTFNENVSPIIDLNDYNIMLNTNSINDDLAVGSSENEPDTNNTKKAAQTRYISKKQQLQTTTTGGRVFVTAYSNYNSNFHLYIRTSKSSDSILHEDNVWVPMLCEKNPDKRNLSTAVGEFIEYEFSLDGAEEFDVFSFKLVLTTTDRHDPPIIRDYRAIMIA